MEPGGHDDTPREVRASHPGGHFYSPVVDPEALRPHLHRLWPEPPLAPAGIDFDDAGHRRLLDEALARYLPEYDYPEHAPADDDALRTFYTRNSQFSWLDSRALFCLLRHWRPRRIIEVGSGYSSLLMADVITRFLDGACALHCIEPYPRAFLRAGIPGIASVDERPVQEVPLEFFDQLEAGDVLFIDSSHVAKTGSDVNHLYLKVLPRLRAGVRIHVHDVFFPYEYPREWVLDENRSWNEQYLVQALLMFSTGFRVRFGGCHAYARHRERLGEVLAHPKGKVYGGASLWIERT